MGFELDTSDGEGQTVAQVTTRSLHDVAQPLTVLQGIIELSLMRDRTADEYRMALETALQEVERVTIRLDHVRHLMRLQLPAGDIGRLSASRAVRTAIDGLRNTMDCTGTEIVLQEQDELRDTVETSEGRVGKALSLVLTAAIQELPQGGRVHASVNPRLDNVLIRIQALTPEAAEPPSVGPEAFLVRNLDLARAIAASAGAELKFTETPFTATLVLPRTASTTAYTCDDSDFTKGDALHV